MSMAFLGAMKNADENILEDALLAMRSIGDFAVKQMGNVEKMEHADEEQPEVELASAHGSAKKQ